MTKAWQTERARRVADGLLVFLVSALCLGWAVGVHPLAGTEGHRAITAHQMLREGNWLVPRLYDMTYLTKPPLIYWVLAGAEALTGRANEWIWRLPSVLGTAGLAAFLCAVANRWWKRPAGLVAGFAMLSLAALWSQSRSADIDALHTMAATVAAVALLALHRSPDTKRWGWPLTGALAFAAALLFKGPACLPLVLGSLLGPVLLTGEWRLLRRLRPWLLLLLGGALFALYAAAAYWSLRTSPTLDTTGLREVARRVHLRDWRQLVEAITLPALLFAYALPASLAIFFLLRRSVLAHMGAPRARLVRLLLGAVLGAMLLGVFALIGNPRYGYVILPLVALFPAALCELVRDTELARRDHLLLRSLLIGISGLFAAAGPILASAASLDDPTWWWPAIVAATSATVGYVTLRAWSRDASWRPLAYLPTLIVLCVLPFGSIKNAQRTRRSAYPAAQVLREHLGDDRHVTTGLMLRTHPELFHYAGAQVHFIPWETFRQPVELPGSTWLVFDARDWHNWSKVWMDRLSRVQPLDTHVPGTVVAWYEKPAPATP